MPKESPNREGKILNPNGSNRYITIGGAVYNKLVKEGLINPKAVEKEEKKAEDVKDVIFVPDFVPNFVPDKKMIIRTTKSILKQEVTIVITLREQIKQVLQKINEKLDKAELNIEGWTSYNLDDYISSLIMSDCASPNKLEIDCEIVEYKKTNKNKSKMLKEHVECIYKDLKKKYKVTGYTKNEHFDALYETIKDRYNL